MRELLSRTAVWTLGEILEVIALAGLGGGLLTAFCFLLLN
jgi:hypothetical protein